MCWMPSDDDYAPTISMKLNHGPYHWQNSRNNKVTNLPGKIVPAKIVFDWVVVRVYRHLDMQYNVHRFCGAPVLDKIFSACISCIPNCPDVLGYIKNHFTKINVNSHIHSLGKGIQKSALSTSIWSLHTINNHTWCLSNDDMRITA